MAIQEVAEAAVRQWGGRMVAGVDLPTVMVAIAGGESNWRADAAGDPGTSAYTCRGYRSWGAWQINMAAHFGFLPGVVGSRSPCAWAAWLSGPGNCARAADVVIGNSATDLPLSALRPWTVWWSPDGDPDHDAGDGNGIYRRYWDQARQAVAQAYPSAAVLSPGPLGQVLAGVASVPPIYLAAGAIGLAGLGVLVAGALTRKRRGSA